MTDEQRKRVHEITYSTDDRMELAERIVKLEDENAKLRELENIRMSQVRHCEDLDKENAKLRELATEAIRLIQAESPDCGLCKHYDECWAGEAMNYSPSGCVICNEARELGLEVD